MQINPHEAIVPVIRFQSENK